MPFAFGAVGFAILFDRAKIKCVTDVRTVTTNFSQATKKMLDKK